MQVVILAAGEGTRMRPLTETTPKVLLKIHSRPVIDYIFDALPDEITDVVVVTRYLGEQVKAYLGDIYRGRAIRYAEGSSKGSAYSLIAARQYIGSSERFLVINGDEFPSAEDVRACLKEPLSVIAFEYDQPEKAGVVMIDAEGNIIGIREKPKNPSTNVVVGGIMVLSGEIFSYEPVPNDKGEFFYTSMLDQFVRDHKVKAVRTESYKGDLTFPHDIERMERLIPSPSAH